MAIDGDGALDDGGDELAKAEISNSNDSSIDGSIDGTVLGNGDGAGGSVTGAFLASSFLALTMSAGLISARRKRMDTDGGRSIIRRIFFLLFLFLYRRRFITALPISLHTNLL